MKRFLSVFLALLFWSGAAQAQEFGFRAGIQTLTILSFQFGSEISFSDWGVGSRFSVGTIGFVSRVQLDAYGFMQISPYWQAYAGVGVAGFFVILPTTSLVDIHALLGLRLNNGFYAEVVPRLFFGSPCADQFNCTSTNGPVRALAYGIDIGIGFSWRL